MGNISEWHRNVSQHYRLLLAEYKKSAVFGDCIYPVVGKTEEGYTVSLNDKEGKAYAVIAFAT